MLSHNIVWIIKLAILLITIKFSTSQKYGYYLTSTYNITSSQAVLSSSELLFNILQIARNFDLEIRGTILNLRNNNKTGDIFCIIYSKETSLNNLNVILTNLSNAIKDLMFYNTSVYLLYFVEIDVELSKTSNNEKNLNTSNTEYLNILNQIKSSPEINSLGIQLFDPPIPTFNKLLVNFQNKPGNLRGTIFATVYSLINYPSSMQLTTTQFFPYYLSNFNATIYQGFWDRLSMYSTMGNSINEFYFIASLKLIQSSISIYQQSDIIDFIAKIFDNISNTLLSYGVGFNGEILNINTTTFTIDFHGSLFRGKDDLREMNYIVSTALSTVSSVSFINFKIYNIYRASIFGYLDNNIYNLNDYLNNPIGLQENLKNTILSRLIQENLFVINDNYFQFIFQWQTFENRIRTLIYLLIYTEKTSLFDVENEILNIFSSLPSVVDPFNSHVERAAKFTTGIYPNYSIPNAIFNVSTDSLRTKEITETTNERLTTIYYTTFQTNTSKESSISTQTFLTTTTKMFSTTSTNQMTTTKEPFTTLSIHETITKEPTATSTSQVTTTNGPTTTSPSQVTTTKEPTAISTNQVTITKEPNTTSTSQVTTTKETNATSTNQVTTTKEPTAISTNKVTTTKEPTTTSTSQVTNTKGPTTTSTSQVTATKGPTTTSTSQVTTTKKPTTTLTIQTTTSKIPTTLTSTIKTITTEKQIQVGETKATVDMTCKFQDDYKDTYSDVNSDDYKSFTNKMTDDIDNSFKEQGTLRLIKVTYNSISKGSIIVDFTLITASSSEINATQISKNIVDITTKALGPNTTIENFNVISIVTITSIASNSINSITTIPPPETWKFVVGGFFGIIGIVGIIFIVLYFLGYLKDFRRVNSYGEIH